MNKFLERIILLTEEKNMLWFEKEILENSIYTGICNTHIFRMKYIILKNKYVIHWILCKKINDKDISCNWSEIILTEEEAKQLYIIVNNNLCNKNVDYVDKTVEKIKNRIEVEEYDKYVDYIAI